MSSQHRKQSTSLNFGRHFVIKFSIRFKILYRKKAKLQIVEFLKLNLRF